MDRNLQTGAVRTFTYAEFKPEGTSEEKFLALYRGLYWIHLTSGARVGTEPYVHLARLRKLYDQNLQEALNWSDSVLNSLGAKRFFSVMIEEVNRGQQSKITME